ncbi:ssDNA-binding domain-containing protein [Escherichia coli]|nr:ssDNA-binding domain-containing protein [Escherichia coli]
MKTKKHTSRTATKTPERDLYQLVTDRVVTAIENGVPPWKRPWRSARNGVGLSEMMPANALTGKPYTGVNVLLLWLAADEAGYVSNYWLTYRQAQQLGGHVRKGEVATLAVIYKDWKKQAVDEHGNRLTDSEGEPLMETVPVLKANPLFNVGQCDGLPEHLMVKPEGSADALPADTISERVLPVLNGSGVSVSSLPQDRAFYRPDLDRIVMPLSSQFDSVADYQATLLHELVHSTGHEKRLRRAGISSFAGRKSQGYAFEELIAEMGSAFLCAHLGITGDVQHESYIDGWLNVLKSDKKALFHACRQAREASEYLLTRRTSQECAA